eukprot:COSAG03_NODE_1143_length_4734_cov_3.483711_1_plen_529_part_00
MAEDDQPAAAPEQPPTEPAGEAVAEEAERGREETEQAEETEREIAEEAAADGEVEAAGTGALGRTHEMLSSSRVHRRRVGERRITAPVRVIKAFVVALFKGIQSTGPLSWAAEEEGVTVEDLLRFVKKQRYRFEATITDEDAVAMFEEADLLQDNVLDRTELANTALSYGIESVHLVQWCTLFNLFVDPHVPALAVPVRVTKRHNLQSNSENYEEARYFKPNLTATHQYKKTNHPTSRPAKGLAVKRCDGRRDVVEYAHSDALNDTVMSGSEEREDGAATFTFGAQDAFDATLGAAADASTESQGAIARGKQHASRYPPWARPWISSAINELAWPAVPGSDQPLTLKDQPPPKPQKDFFLNFHMDSNQDMRTQYALSVQGDNGPYHPPSLHKFREEADPIAAGHPRNFQRFILNREPCVRPFESQRTGPYMGGPAAHSFRVPPGAHRGLSKADYERTGWQHRSAPVQTSKFETVFSKKQKELDIGTGEEYKRLPLPSIDPYLAHKATVRGTTLNHLPRQTWDAATSAD